MREMLSALREHRFDILRYENKIAAAIMAVLLRLAVDRATAHLAPWARETERTIPFGYLRRISAS